MYDLGIGTTSITFGKGTDHFGKSSGKIFDKGLNAFKKFDIKNAYVKPKHLSTSNGNGAKFLGENKTMAEETLKKAMSKGNILSITDNGITQKGQQSYNIIINSGQTVGTKGEQLIKIVISDEWVDLYRSW